jgi:protein-L-isoaspartate(D-aspartate) O-methyltransferase
MSAVLKTPVSDYAAARTAMVDSQLRPNNVRDRKLLDAMEGIPRELFVPSNLACIAYIDEDLKVAQGRYLMEPMILARLIQEAEVTATSRVLDVAPATGYSTAVLATLAHEVVGVESEPLLQTQANQILASLQIQNATVQVGALSEGWKAKAPYDVILINGSVDSVPETLLSQLGEGGRLVAVYRQWGPADVAHVGEARLYQKIRGTVSYRPLFDANIKPLSEFQAPAKFTFN